MKILLIFSLLFLFSACACEYPDPLDNTKCQEESPAVEFPKIEPPSIPLPEFPNLYFNK